MTTNDVSSDFHYPATIAAHRGTARAIVIVLVIVGVSVSVVAASAAAHRLGYYATLKRR
jgi:hypothetical protein